MSIKAVSPSEARGAKSKYTPPEIIEAVNELLSQHYRPNGIVIKQKDIIALARAKMATNESPNANSDFFSQGWMDFEPIYEAQGWKVRYDKPGWDENYDAFFEFKEK